MNRRPALLGATTLVVAASSLVIGAPASPATAASELGDPCRPWEVSDNPDLVCQATDEMTEIGPYVRNARAGDLLLDPKCGGLGALLRAMSPPQRYAHTGIFVDDFSTIRHSTASTARTFASRYVEFDPRGPYARIRDDVLRYGWPGVIEQSVASAFKGQAMVDPAHPVEEVEVRGFVGSARWCPGDAETETDDGSRWPVGATPPLLVKPPPCAGAEARERAREVAARARAIEHGHYRLFAYTDATIVNDPDFDGGWQDGGWEAGAATMCSSFIWQAATAAGVIMEGASEPGERRASGIDGLYEYSAAERLRGAGVLHDHIKAESVRQIQEEVPDLFGPLTAPLAKAVGTELANQVVSCLWDDSCVPEETGWRAEPGTGVSVSPHDLRQWDSPETTPGAVYGFEEPAFYRDGAEVLRHEWVEHPHDFAEVKVAVVDLHGAPVPFADVQIGPQAVLTDRDGVAVAEIPVGRYEVSGFRVLHGTLLEGNYGPLDTSKEPAITLTLSPQNQSHREVVVTGSADLEDDEDWSADEGASVSLFASAHLDPWTDDHHTDEPDDAVAEVNTRDQVCAGNEVSGVVKVVSTLNHDNSIDARVVLAGYEDDDSSGACQQVGDDLIKETEEHVHVPEDGVVTVSLAVEDSSRGSVQVELTIENRYQRYPEVGSPEACV